MTLVVVLKGTDGLVLAGDSRGTFGDPRELTAQNDTQEKSYILSRHVGALIAGDGGLASLLLRKVIEQISSQGLDGVTPVMYATRQVLIQQYEEFFPNFPYMPMQGIPIPARPAVHLLIAGYDLSNEGTPTSSSIYSMNAETNFAPALHDYGFALDGIPQYALYLLNRLYDPQAAVEELVALAAYAITETASQDGKVGGPVQMLTITPDGGCDRLALTRVARILKRNDARSRNLRRSFFAKAGGK